ncbi:hypothetical protein BVX95_01060 [archaeon D22]|nr:hypothetical protein BVX95_01060 [archaeon D22]
MLENLYSQNILQKNFYYAFVLGFAYAIIGIGIAVLLFPNDPALVSVAFTALMFYPTLRKFLRKGEIQEAEKIEPSGGIFFKDKSGIFKVYSYYFIGVLLSFSFLAILMPSLAANHLFNDQISILYGHVTGNAIFTVPLFEIIFFNNLTVMILCFVSALLIGDGAVFLLTWNASVWGTIFGTLAKTASHASNKDPIIYFLLIFLIVFTHLIIEAFSYMVAATSGSILSQGFIGEKIRSKTFFNIFVNAFILIILAFIILFIGAVVETFVLDNSILYKTIISQGF